jgi:hypothetical protein
LRFDWNRSSGGGPGLDPVQEIAADLPEDGECAGAVRPHRLADFLAPDVGNECSGDGEESVGARLKAGRNGQGTAAGGEGMAGDDGQAHDPRPPPYDTASPYVCPSQLLSVFGP